MELYFNAAELVRVYTTYGLPFEIQEIAIRRMVDELNELGLPAPEYLGFWRVERREA